MNIVPLISAERAADLLARAEGLEFVDGRATAKGSAKDAKANAQARRHGPGYDTLAEEVLGLLSSDARVRDLAFPRAFSRPLVNRYAPGDRYGLHVDGAVVGSVGSQVRTDLSFTLFLTPPEDYAGGELQLMLDGGMRALKLPAGSLALYPTHALHQVTPVTEGSRTSVVGWIESWIADAPYRQLMTKLRQVQAGLEGATVPAVVRLTMTEVAEGLLRHGMR